MKINRRQATRAKKRKSGFTLIEVIAVLVLLGILAAIAVPKYIDMADNARNRAIDAGVAEMNGREALTWGNNMLTGWTVDALPADTNLNNGAASAAGYQWASGPTTTAGGLKFQTSTAVALTRIPATAVKPASWSRTP